MVEEKSWSEFQEAGLLWWINMLLHTFGWAIVLDIQDGNIKRVYPARVRFRGFGEKDNTDGYRKISSFMQANAEQLKGEADE